MRLFQLPSDNLQCPHCGFTHEQPAGTFPVPFKFGDESQSLYECEQCGDEFIVTRDTETRVTVKGL